MPRGPSPQTLEELLEPIAADAPAGTSLRYDGIYDKVRAARRADDPSLPQGEWQTTLKKADLDAVATLCEDALATRSKDLQLAVWLVDAWTQLRGLAGLAGGLQLTAALCERFWDTMFPPLEDGSADDRVGLIDWMDDALALRLRLLPLTDPGSGTPFSLSEWEAARARAAKPETSSRNAPPEEPRGPTWEGILSQTSQAGRAHWLALRKQVGEALAAAGDLEGALGAMMGGDPPVVHRTKEALRGVAGVVEQAARSFGELPPEEVEAAPDEDGGGAHASFAPGGPIRGRAEAYQRLMEAADYLLRTEPHSPVPYLVMRAVSWGNMSLVELLHEFIDRADDLVAIQVLLGMRKRE